MPVKYIAPVKKETVLPLICDGQEHRLDVGAFTPTLNTLLLAAPYLNFDDADMSTEKPGRVEVWMRRAAFNGEKADDTFFVGLWMVREGYSHKDDRPHMEWCEKDRPLAWYYKTSGLLKCNLGTRYVKYALVT